MLESFASALLAVSLLSVDAQATPSAAEWDNDYGRARAHARSAGRPLLVVVDNPAGPRQRIEPVRQLGGQPVRTDAGRLSGYELCRVDASTEYGRKVAEAFGAEELPYVAILDKTGQKIIYQHAGPMTDAQWQTTLATHRRGELPRAVPASHAVPMDYQAMPVNYSYFQQPMGLYDPSYCPSCQLW